MTPTLTPEDRDDLRLLRRLYADTHPASAAELRRATGLSPAAVAAGLSRLRAAGCAIEEHPQHGLRLVEAGLGVWRPWLAEALGEPMEAIHVYRETSSTQDRATTHRRPGVFVADRQSAGRGRFGRRWEAPGGASLLVTVGVGVDAEPHPAGEGHGARVTAAAAVGVVEAIRDATGVTPRLKWPNDVLLHDGKLAGILVERAGGGDMTRWLIGIGLNVNRPDAAALPRVSTRPPAWLSDAARDRIDRLPLLVTLVRSVRAWVRPERHREAIARWRQACTAQGDTLVFASAGREVRGEVIDVDLDAGLVVRGDHGQLVHLPAATTSALP